MFTEWETYFVPSPPFAYLTDAAGFQWVDLGALAGLLALYCALVFIWPAIVLRPVWWVVTHTVYRLRVFGRSNVPASGPVLLVCNHVSYVDWMLIWTACPRPIRFVAWAGWKKNLFLRLSLRVTDSIPIDGEAGPKAILSALRQISDALDRGEVVCIFPEARLTRTGAMLPFHRGFERILKQTKAVVPVIPTCISQIWGSIFSYRGGRLIWKWPERVPYPVAVTFGETMPATATAVEVRFKIQELSADMAVRDSDRSRSVHRHFVRVAANVRQMFRPCLIDTASGKPRILSYAKTLVGAILVARWLKPRLGAERNIGIWLPSSVGGVLTNIAIFILGRTSVNLNYTAGMDSTRSAAKQTGMKVVITAKRFLARMPLDLGEGVTLIHLEDSLQAIGKWQRLRWFLTVLLLPGWMLDRWVLRLGRQSLDNIATIVFSSGSTGDPKGVMLSHRNITCNAESMVSHIKVDHHDRILGVLPFFHSFGYTVTLWMPLLIGASTVYHADPRQAQEIGQLCRTYRCTAMLATATFLRFYLRRCDAEDFRSLRLLICGAEKLPVKLAQEFDAKFGVMPLEGYGCTELSPVVSANVPDQEIGGMKQVGNKFGTIGHPIPGVATRIVDADTLQPLPPGQDGLVFCTGANVMVGYLHKPELTAQVVINGWYNTGDMGHLDPDGFLTLTGRLSRFAKIAGEMVPLEKVEEDLLAINGAADRVLAVTSVPDEKKGERLIVLYLASLSMPIAELTTQLGERGLPNLWIPNDRDFYLIEELPVLGSGKLDLRRVKEIAMRLALNRLK